MIGKNVLKLMQKNARPMLYTRSAFQMPKRNWTQVGVPISTPPRVPVSYGEKLLHMFFMGFMWLAPCMYALTQIKVWRREYVQ